VKPYTVLEATAGFYKMHGIMGSLAGITCFLLRLSEPLIAGITIAATVAGYFMAVYAVYPPGLLRLARAYSMFTGYGLILLGISILGLATVGLVGTAIYWLSRLFAEIITMAHARRMGRRYLDMVAPEASTLAKRTGLYPDGFALRCFGNAYGTYASRLGLPIEAVGTEEELGSGKWRHVLREFTQEWPEVARRFQVTEAEWQELLPTRGA
jgi:hypothetical protein